MDGVDVVVDVIVGTPPRPCHLPHTTETIGSRRLICYSSSSSSSLSSVAFPVETIARSLILLFFPSFFVVEKMQKYVLFVVYEVKNSKFFGTDA